MCVLTTVQIKAHVRVWRSSRLRPINVRTAAKTLDMPVKRENHDKRSNEKTVFAMGRRTFRVSSSSFARRGEEDEWGKRGGATCGR